MVRVLIKATRDGVSLPEPQTQFASCAGTPPRQRQQRPPNLLWFRQSLRNDFWQWRDLSLRIAIEDHMRHFRVEGYEGCGLTISRPFDSRQAAELYARSILAVVVRIIDIDENGAAILTK